MINNNQNQNNNESILSTFSNEEQLIEKFPADQTQIYDQD